MIELYGNYHKYIDSIARHRVVIYLFIITIYDLINPTSLILTFLFDINFSPKSC